MIELATGLDDPSKEPSTFDPRAASSDPAASEVLASGDDLARIGRRARHATDYLVKRKRDLVLVILPVYGLGYASMLHGFLALEPDGETVVSLSIYEHKETPGLGAKIDDPAWQALWLGKKVRDEQGVLRVGVAKGPAAQEDAPYQVDGISGATRTGRGITNALRFWLGKHGFEPFLQRLKSGEFRS